MGPLLITLFVCVISFGTFETTIAMLVKGNSGHATFNFSFQQVCLLFAYIGFSLALAQGLLVRRLSGKIHEGAMATTGAITEIVGFWLIAEAAKAGNIAWLLVSLSIVVLGFSFLMPSLNSLISRRSDPSKQGGILGVAQSLSALARIIGPLIGIPLLQQSVALPYYVAAGLMAFGLMLVILAVRGGSDFPHAPLAERAD